MKDPKPWIEDPSPFAALEQRVLSEGTHLEEPAGLVDRAWADFTSRLDSARDPEAPGGDTASPEIGLVGSIEGAGAVGGGPVASLSVAVLKSLGVGASLGLLGMGAFELAQDAPIEGFSSAFVSAPAVSSSASPSEPRRPAPAIGRANAREHSEGGPPSEKRSLPNPSSARFRNLRSAPLPSPAMPAPSTAALEGAHSPRTGEESPVVAFPSVDSTSDFPRTAVERENELRKEARDLAQAKNLLQAGHAREAHALLQSGVRSVNSLLPERELLTVEALVRLGQLEAARRRVEAFEARFPRNPFAPQMRRTAKME